MVIRLPDDLQSAIAHVSERLETRMSELLLVPGKGDTDGNIICMTPKQKAKEGDARHVRGEETVLEAMRYSTLGGGKRLRSFLAVTSAGLFGVSIDAAIEATRNFFEGLGVPTRLSGYGLDGSSIPALLAKLEEHGMTKLGEHGDITLDVSRRIYEAAR